MPGGGAFDGCDRVQGKGSSSDAGSTGDGAGGSSDGGESAERHSASASSSNRNTNTTVTNEGASNPSRSGDGSTNDGESSDGASSGTPPLAYEELHGQLNQINDSIQAHRSAMSEHRRIMMEQIEGILNHLSRSDHPIHRLPGRRKGGSSAPAENGAKERDSVSN